LRKYKRRHEHRRKMIKTHTECKFDAEGICIICDKDKWERKNNKLNSKEVQE
jgi:hypothetical protein